MIPHFLCYQGFAVNDYDFTLDAADLGHPRLSLNWGNTNLSKTRQPKLLQKETMAGILQNVV